MNHFTISKIYGNMGYIPVFSVGRIRIKDQVSRLQFTIADSHSFVYQAFCFACCIHSIQISNTSCSITPVNQGRTIIPSRIISSALGITTSYSIQSCPPALPILLSVPFPQQKYNLLQQPYKLYYKFQKGESPITWNQPPAKPNTTP